jgi:hypothetical protein
MIIDNLINKGDQKSLQIFKDENKIVFIDDEASEEDINNYNFYFLELFYRRFCYQNEEILSRRNSNVSGNIDNNKNHFNPWHNSTVNILNEEQILIEQLIEKISNCDFDSKNKFKCFML